MDSITCRVCGEVKPLDAYHRHKNKPNGRMDTCIPCRMAAIHERYGTKPARRQADPDYDEHALQRLLARREIVGDCWVFRGSLMNGYGQVRYRGRGMGAHRVAYILLVGPERDGMELDHLCRNRACFNPEHLELVPHKVNMRRAGPHNYYSRKTHCVRGHEYTPENTRTYTRPSTGRTQRFCRECERLRNNRSRHNR